MINGDSAIRHSIYLAKIFAETSALTMGWTRLFEDSIQSRTPMKATITSHWNFFVYVRSDNKPRLKILVGDSAALIKTPIETFDTGRQHLLRKSAMTIN